MANSEFEIYGLQNHLQPFVTYNSEFGQAELIPAAISIVLFT